MRTIRNTISLMAMLMLTVPMWSQEPSVSKQINQIKRNTQYLYAEATMSTYDEAAEVAYELLMQQVDEYIGSKKKLSSANDVLVKDIKQNSQTLDMRRGEMTRVFIYVRKSDIEGVSNVTMVSNGQDSEPQTPSSPSAQPQGEAPAKPDAHPDVQPALEVTVAEEPTRPELRKTVIPIVMDQPRVTDESTASEPVLGNGNVQSPLSGWQRDAVDELLKCANIAEVKAKLRSMKSAYKVKRYGTPDNCPDRAAAFWVVFGGDGTVLAILGNGAAERIDYRTMTMSKLDNYKGADAMWFMLSK